MDSELTENKKKQGNRSEFEITASVNALNLECTKDGWHPEKLIILWSKNTTSHTKPVPWQPGVNNPHCGIHVWPEPDPVKFTSTLYKNIEREGTCEEHMHEIIIQNVTKKGRRRMIATGSFDLAEYVSKEEHTFDITVSLKPANKYIVSGQVEFQLTSVRLEGGDPVLYQTETPGEDITVTEDLCKVPVAVPCSEEKGKELRRKAPSPPRPPKPSNMHTGVEVPSSEEKRFDTDAIEVNELSTETPGKQNPVTEDSPKIPVAFPTNPHTRSEVPSSVEKRFDSNEVNMSLSFQGPENDNEHLSNGVDTRGEKKEKEVKYPKELNPFEDSSSADEPSKQAPGQDTTVAEDSRKIPVAVPCSEEKVKKKRRNAPPPPRPPRPSTEYPKELNPFGDSSNEDELCEDPRTIPAEPVPCSEETEGQSNEATSLSIQGPESNNEKPSNNAHTPSPSSRRDRKLLEYARTELKALKKEKFSLRRVLEKVESEIKGARKMKDCQEELDGLMKDWLSLNENNAELALRKQNLQKLEKQQDLDECCDIIRTELKFYFQMEDWRKSDYHRAQEDTLLELLSSFVDKLRENY